jgi:DNA-binding CsgD family transcriptional regulator
MRREAARKPEDCSVLARCSMYVKNDPRLLLAGPRETPRPAKAADAGAVLVDFALRPVAFDRGAAAILGDASLQLAQPRRGIVIPKQLADVVRGRRPSDLAGPATHFVVGKQEYICRVYPLDHVPDGGSAPMLVLLFEKALPPADAIDEVSAEYRLTDREQEALKGIAMGLTTKEVASRMNISPNTVKAFLRLVMLKMGVATRAGIAAALLQRNHRNGDSGAASNSRRSGAGVA